MKSLGIENREQIEIFVKCTDLKKMDFLSKSDPRVNLYHREGKSCILIGRTEIINETLNPIFKTTITMDYIFQTNQVILCIVEDHDGADIFEEIGRRSFELSSVMRSPNFTFKFEIVDKKNRCVGKVELSAQKVVREKYSYKIDLKCKDIKDLEWFSKSDPMIRISRPRPQFETKKTAAEIPEEEWVRVHQTEFKKDDLNPDFEPFEISGSRLCRGNENMILRMEVWDYSKGGESEIKRIGKAYFTMAGLLSGNEKIMKIKDDKNKPAGDVILESIEKVRRFDVIDYLEGGLTLNLVVSIDFTSSNGDPKKAGSLHRIQPGTANAYQQVIRSISKVLFQYDADKQISVYGFGAKMPIIGIPETQDFFMLQTNDIESASNVEEALELYQSAFEFVELGGPCRLGPSIKSTAEWARKNRSTDKYFYGIMIILTDGEVEDMDDTVSAIVEASSTPLSILIVGVGNQDFTQLKFLDGDKKRLKDRKGKLASRDIVQFIDYKTKQTMESLSEELLAELPAQIELYFKMAKIYPANSGK